MLVPDSVVYCAPGAAERMFTPGALTSGFSWSESGVGPLEENEATTPGGPSRVVVTAPTVIASRVEPGRRERAAAELAEVVAGGDDGHDAGTRGGVSACATMSRLGSTSGSPSDMLITSMPSLTAASIAATSSGELPSRPTSAAVGIVSAL